MKPNLKLLAFLGLSAFALTACKGLMVQGVNLGQLVDVGSKVLSSDDIKEEDEVVMGGQMAAIILGSAPLHNDLSLQKYVNRVGQWVALHSERPSLSWRFAVVDTQAINAFAMPGGFVVVTSGMLDLLSNEAELAAVLAHEIAHVNDKHYLKAMEKTQNLSLVGDIAGLAGDVYQAKKGSAVSDNFHRNRAVAEKLINTTTDLYSKGLERDDEFEADSHAVTLLARAGYDPFAMGHVLQKLAMLSADDSALQMLFNSHPAPDDRIQSVMSTYEQLSVTTGQQVTRRFDRVMAQVKNR